MIIQYGDLDSYYGFNCLKHVFYTRQYNQYDGKTIGLKNG